MCICLLCAPVIDHCEEEKEEEKEEGGENSCVHYTRYTFDTAESDGRVGWVEDSVVMETTLPRIEFDMPVLLFPRGKVDISAKGDIDPQSAAITVPLLTTTRSPPPPAVDDSSETGKPPFLLH